MRFETHEQLERYIKEQIEYIDTMDLVLLYNDNFRPDDEPTIDYHDIK